MGTKKSAERTHTICVTFLRNRFPELHTIYQIQEKQSETHLLVNQLNE